MADVMDAHLKPICSTNWFLVALNVTTAVAHKTDMKNQEEPLATSRMDLARDLS